MSAADGRDQVPGLPPLPPPSVVEVALRRALAATPIKAPSRPLSRRSAAVWNR
jgi:hypothetical protein